MSVRSFWDKESLSPRWISQKYYADPFLPYEEIVRMLDDLKPDIVFSYGSYIEHFFRFLIDTGASPACLASGTTARTPCPVNGATWSSTGSE